MNKFIMCVRKRLPLPYVSNLITSVGTVTFKCNSLHIITYYLQLNYLVTVTYYPYNKVTIIILHNYYITLCPQSCVKLPLYHVA